MKKNRGVVYQQPGEVKIQEIAYPSLSLGSRPCEHGVILKVVLSGICGSDQHMVRGKTTAPSGIILGHEITGQVIECGRDVEFIKNGDLVSVPFNVACGRCVNCKEQKTHLCLNVNPSRAGGAYGYVDMGGWVGGQAEYVMVPYADFNLLKLPPLSEVKNKIKDLALITDIFPTGFHGAINAGVKAGSFVYIAGAGPVGLCAAYSAKLLGAALVIVGDVKANRLERAKSLGCHTIDLSVHAQISGELKRITGSSTIECFIDCVGFEAYAQGTKKEECKANIVLNTGMETVKAGGAISIPGLYVTDDPSAKDEQAKHGVLGIELGIGWSKAISMGMGQTPVMKYNYYLMQVLLNSSSSLAQAVGVKVVSLDEAPDAYKDFDSGTSVKYLIDPHGMTV